MLRKIVHYVVTVSLLLTLIAGCGASAPESATKKIPLAVKAQSVAESKVLRERIQFPGLLLAEKSATLTARVTSTVAEIPTQVGEHVTAGAVLLRLTDDSSTTANSVKQAELAVEQARSSRDLAQKNYDNLVRSVAKDLQSAGIAQSQAEQGKSNLSITTMESIRSAEQAVTTAGVALDQATVALANRQALATQAVADAKVNARAIVDMVVNVCNTIIDGTNQLLALSDDDIVSLVYKTNLGALDSSIITASESAYKLADSNYTEYTQTSFANVSERVAETLTLTQKTKQLADASMRLLEKTISSSNLPATSTNGGTSLASLKSTVAGYQAQINSSLAQINGATQLLTNTELNNKNQLDALQKSHELAVEQKKSATQNLVSVRAGNTSSLDSAGFGVSSAQNQYETLKIKLNTSIATGKSQLDLAELNLKNALVALDTATSNHVITAPIDGTVTQKFVSVGSAVAPGTPLISLSQTTNLKIQFYVDEEYLAELKSGFKISVTNNSAQNFSAIVTAVSPVADSVTKRFLVEAVPDQGATNLPPSGSVVDVSFDSAQTTQNPDTIFLPLSALTIGQNENSIFVVEKDFAKKIVVKILRVAGEHAEVHVDLPPETEIVVEGNKLLQEGDAVEISK